MRLLKIALASVLLSACGPQLPDTWTATGPEPLNWRLATTVAREQSPCGDVGPWGGSIQFTYQPVFSCGEYSAIGCDRTDDSGAPALEVSLGWVGIDATQTPLMHELGHVLFERCGIRDWDPSTGQHEPMFLMWVSTANLALTGAEQGVAVIRQP